MPNLCYMGHTIWNREFITDFGRQPGLEITPEGYILIRKLAAVFQSHCRNFTFYFIFSKPACPSFFSQSSHFLGVLGCHSGDMARVLRELGNFGEVSTPCWIKRGMGLRKKKKIPSKVKHRNSCGLVPESQGCNGERLGVQRSSERSREMGSASFCKVRPAEGLQADIVRMQSLASQASLPDWGLGGMHRVLRF